MTFSIIIPAWRGVGLLKKNLPAVLKLGANEVIVIDDASPENDGEFVRQYFPKIKVLKNGKNLGFGSTVNKGVSQAVGEIIILLNQDVKPDKDILKYLQEDFNDPGVFGISLAEEQFGPTKGNFKDGFIVHNPVTPRPSKITPTFWISGGSGAYRKRYWNELKGFDPIYDPGYWEDIDISYRAREKGWKILWDPRAKVEHEHEKTFGSKHYDQKYKSLIQERNHLLFNWRNLDTNKLLIHYFNLLKRIMLHPGYLKIILMALKKVSVQQ